MANYMLVAHVQTSSDDARQEVIGALRKAWQYARDNEPGVLKYTISIPQQPEPADSPKSIWMIEEYADEATQNAHMASSPVVSLLELFSSSPHLMAAPIDLSKLTFHATFTRPEVASHTRPLINLVQLHYEPGSTNVALEMLGKDSKDETRVMAVEVYADEQGYETHRQSDAVKKALAAQGKTRIGTEIVTLKLVDGYFYRDDWNF